ncbi:unnamed protein product [Nesidiocoris tenuis]|uniref:Ig-like domain-containing protein n=1 Tax=Nesidiocoris tenuis TaxID=355587 RepID=A0A6H5G4Q1_9HEMI|nr:unnamed protein product [Nesidiocoris tenuis]
MVKNFKTHHANSRNGIKSNHLRDTGITKLILPVVLIGSNLLSLLSKLTQVSTGAGIMSHFVNLEIVVPEAFIVGATEYHVVVGGTINLVCVIEKSPTPPQYVLWYHNSKMINYDTSRGGVQVRTEQGQKTESHLTIHDAKFSDSGNYTCSASNTQPAYIHVFVSEGDKMAAISRRKSSSSGHIISAAVWYILLPNFFYLT